MVSKKNPGNVSTPRCSHRLFIAAPIFDTFTNVYYFTRLGNNIMAMYRSLNADVLIMSATTAENLLRVTTLRSKMKTVQKTSPLTVDTVKKQQAMVTVAQTEKRKG